MGKGLRSKLIRIFFAASLLGVGFVSGQFYLGRIYQRQVEVSYRRALGELGTHFQALTAEIGRARLAMSAKQRGLIASNLRRLIYAAQSNMGELPLGEIHLERIAHLLAGVYEQTYAYVQADFDEVSLEELHKQTEYVNHELQGILIHKERQFPWVAWHEYLSTKVAVPKFLQTLALINDGLEDIKAPPRRGEIVGEIIDKEQALHAAQVFCDRKDLNFQVTNESKGEIPSYTIEAKDGESLISIEVSQKGGLVLWMTVTQEVLESRLAFEEIAELGAQFLEKRGFPLLHVTDLQVVQNKAIVTFVPERGGILRYGEPLKVQISLADGNVLGFWGTPYYLAQSRVRGETESVEGAAWNIQDKIRAGVEILDKKRALILNERQEEVLTTRLGVQYHEDYYLIYINEETGEEEQIVQVSSPDLFSLGSGSASR